MIIIYYSDIGTPIDLLFLLYVITSTTSCIHFDLIHSYDNLVLGHDIT
jgi:hypothetical protein